MRRISVDGRVMVNDSYLATRAAVAGLGIAFTPEALAEPFLRSGQLIRVLEDWSPSFRDSSSIILGTGRCRPVFAPSLTCSAPCAARRRQGGRARIRLPRNNNSVHLCSPNPPIGA